MALEKIAAPTNAGRAHIGGRFARAGTCRLNHRHRACFAGPGQAPSAAWRTGHPRATGTCKCALLASGDGAFLLAGNAAGDAGGMDFSACVCTLVSHGNQALHP